MITRIEFVEVTEDYRVFRLVGTTAEPDQYIKVPRHFDNDGTEIRLNPELAVKKTKTLTVWE